MSDNPLRRILTLRCGEAARLASDSLDRPLGVADRVGLRLHLWICRPCHRFLHQLREMRDAARRIGQVEPDALGPPMPDDVRERLTRTLDEV